MKRPSIFGMSALPLSALLATLACLSSTAMLRAQAPVNQALPAPPPVSEVKDGSPMPIVANADDSEVLEAGPVHEAFAELVTLDENNGMVAPKAPPEPINEIPPDVKPEGTNVEWFPGYWAWSDDMEDFIWISGVWRDVPPGQQFVPGYWNETSEGWVWVSGFWTNEEQDELAYLPAPPATLNTAPTSPQPGIDYFWVPGCWQYRNAGYAWQAGFWTRGYSNWIWVPNRYRWTPRGYVYLRGYWDYPLARRGCLFSPIRYRRPIYLNAGYRYTPYRWVNTSLLLTRLFLAPSRGHYYYGNYAGPRYVSAGFRPWIQINLVRGGYDPFYTYASWNAHRSRNSNWINSYRNDFDRLARVSTSGPSRNAPDRHDAPREFFRDIRDTQDLKEIGNRFVRLNDDQRIAASRSRVNAFDTIRTQRALSEHSRKDGPDRDIRRGPDRDGRPSANDQRDRPSLAGRDSDNRSQRSNDGDRGPNDSRASRDDGRIERGTFKLPSEAREILNQHRKSIDQRSGERPDLRNGDVPRSSLIPEIGSGRSGPDSRSSRADDKRATSPANRPTTRETPQPIRQRIPGAEEARDRRMVPESRNVTPERGTPQRGNDGRDVSPRREGTSSPADDARRTIQRSIENSTRPRSTETPGRNSRPESNSSEIRRDVQRTIEGINRSRGSGSPERSARPTTSRPNPSSSDVRNSIQRSIENSVRSRTSDSGNRSFRPAPSTRTPSARPTPSVTPQNRSSRDVQRAPSSSNRNSRPAFQPSGRSSSKGVSSRPSGSPSRSSGAPSRSPASKGRKGK